MGDINSTGKKTLCSFIAIIMASCIALSVSGIVAGGVLKSQQFVEKRMLKCDTILLDELNRKTDEVMSANSTFPVKAFTDAVGSAHINTALKQVSGNLVYGFKTDFSKSEYLYGYYKTGLTSYCNRNNIAIDPSMEDMISRDSSLAVDVFNQACGDESTNFVIPFLEAQSSDPVVAAFACWAIIIVCALILRKLNFGDYFMYSYGAMSVIIAGALMIILPLFALVMDYPSLFSFTDVEAYNVGIKYCIEDVLKILAGTGGVLALIGIVSMNVVYNRYCNIVSDIQTEMDIAEKLRKEYMQEQFRFEMENGLLSEEETNLQNENQPILNDVKDDNLANAKPEHHKKKNKHKN